MGRVELLLIPQLWFIGSLTFTIEAFELAWRHGATRKDARPWAFPGVELASLYAVLVSLGFGLLAGLASQVLAIVPLLLSLVAMINRRVHLG